MTTNYDALDREKWRELLTADHERVCHGQCPGPRRCETAFIAAILDENAALRAAAEGCWQLLDDIDTASDVWKGGWEQQARYAQKTVQKRHTFMVSDGYNLALGDAS